uniref:addiction module antidote protein n=1 Tax=Candidatus Electronema sp. TaxID=2698783 RepID=UPI004055EAC0
MREQVTTKKWDASEYLDSPEMIREYLKVSFEQGDSEQLIMALGQVAKAQGISDIARKADISRQNLYKVLSGGSSPKFETVKKVVEALGCKLAIV